MSGNSTRMYKRNAVVLAQFTPDCIAAAPQARAQRTASSSKPVAASCPRVGRNPYLVQVDEGRVMGIHAASNQADRLSAEFADGRMIGARRGRAGHARFILFGHQGLFGGQHAAKCVWRICQCAQTEHTVDLPLVLQERADKERIHHIHGNGRTTS
jgi:hypothetical protein